MIQLAVNILISFSIILLVALSFSIVFYPTKFFNLAHAIIITFGAYFIYLFNQQFQLDFSIATLLAIISATTIGTLSEVLIYKPLRRRNASPLIMLIASLGLYVILQNIISLVWGDATKTIRSANVNTGNEIWGATITNVQLIIIAVSIIIFTIYLAFQKNTKAGIKIRAISENAELSRIFGIDTERIYLLVFILGSVIASISGILIAFEYDMKPTMGFNYLLYGVIALIIGGVGSNWGLIFGSLLVTIAQHIGAYYFGTIWMDVIAFIILIIFLIWKPLGFSGKRLKKIEI